MSCTKKLMTSKLNPKQIKLRGIGDTMIETDGFFRTIIEIDDESYEGDVHVVPQNSLNVDCIIGNDFLEGTNIKLVRDRVEIKKIPREEEEKQLCCLEFVEEKESYEVGLKEYALLVDELVQNYLPYEVLKEAPVVMKILLKNDVPVWQAPRRIAPIEKEIVENQIHEWIEKGIIRPSNSEYASPIVLVNKKDNSKRLCVFDV